MAESAVSFVVEKLANLAAREAALLLGVGDQIESVKTELTRMQCFLKDADAKLRKGDERVKNWVREIRDVAYQAEDVIDIFMVKIGNRRRRMGLMGSLSRYACIPNELVARHRIGVQMEKIKARIEDISKSRATFGIADLGEVGDVWTASADHRLQARRRLPPHFDEDSDIVGFEAAKQILVNQLLDPRRPRRTIISIVGMGGIGKTTLARKVYNNSEVKTDFDASAWITVSQNYNIGLLLKDLAKKIADSFKEKTKTSESRNGEHLLQIAEALKSMEDDKVREELYKFLKKIRYLIVLDDVWQTEACDLMKEIFPNVNNGSRLMLTTRSLDVAKNAKPAFPYHELHPLNDDESWELFCKKAFLMNEDVQTSCLAELEGLGRKLVKACGGLPLALVVLGGLLSRKDLNYNVWSEVAKSMDWESTIDGQTCLGIIALSYDDLPHHYLRSCFLYIGLFPEDFIISTSRLIKLWIAEGFIPQKPDRSMEETARGYLDELIQRSMIQIAERSIASGKIKGIRIHDILRDLCISGARRDGFMSVCSDSTNLFTSTGVYRVALLQDINTNTELASLVPNLHTLLCFDGIRSNEFYSGLKFLRVIDMNDSRRVDDALPEEIGSLIHLRYLRWTASGSGIKRLPSSIGNLYNLQTLLLPESHLQQVPNAFWKIRSLRHIDGVFEQDFISPVKKLATLEFLQTLRYVRAGRWIEKDLAETTNLRKLGITSVLPTHEAALTSSFGKLDHLASLHLEGKIIPTKIFTVFPDRHHLRALSLGGNISEFPASNEFPPNLTKLTLSRFLLTQDAIRVLEKLPSLVYLRLRPDSYRDNLISCSVGGFPKLCHLIFNECLLDGLHWIAGTGAMPKLTHLTISCSGLNIWLQDQDPVIIFYGRNNSVRTGMYRSQP